MTTIRNLSNSLKEFDFVMIGAHLPKANYFPKMLILIEIIEERGFTVGFYGKGRCLVSYDFAPKFENELNLAVENGIPRVLIREETDTVYPYQYSPEVETQFSRIFTLGAIPGTVFGDCLKFPYQPYRHHHKNQGRISLSRILRDFDESGVYSAELWGKRKEKILFVGANKMIEHDELYQLRRQIIHSLGEAIEVYGDNWQLFSLKKMIYLVKYLKYSYENNRHVRFSDVKNFILTRVKSEKDTLDDKLSALVKSKYNLIFENSYNFVTEKVFDAIICGAIPIYFGSEEIFSPRLREIVWVIKPNISLKQALLEIDKVSRIDYRKWLGNTREFLYSEEFLENWTAQSVFSNLADELCKLVVRK